MKKGRHRRFEEARALKRTVEVVVEPCAECGAAPDAEHASWCLATEDLDLDDDEDAGPDNDTPAYEGPTLGSATGGSPQVGGAPAAAAGEAP
ncbi:MAG: hypothetical protein QOG82_2005 [Actinomycetota bacterium]|nr:hypothetical protein [Actinomycetota bacterium]